MEQFFSLNYRQARERFRRYAQKKKADLDHFQLQARGPAEEFLYTDFAWIGTKSPRKVLLLQSGVHGVEAFAGAAVQCCLLHNLPPLPDDMALILVHVLNPFGMAWMRRVNESNVDLNRNCLAGDQIYRGAADGYVRLNSLINPNTPPSRDFFFVRACFALLRYGLKPLRQGIACGQYQYPAGLFYGGAKLEEGPLLYRRWLMRHMPPTEQILVADFHTGLGKFGRYQVFLGLPADLQQQTALRRMLGEAIVIDKREGGAYDITGGVACLFEQLDLSARPIYLTVEFGTYPLLRVLHALREENRCHFYTARDSEHPAKRRLQEMLCPSSATWRNLVLRQGRALVGRLITHLASS